MRPRQARYQAALRPDKMCTSIIRHLQRRMLLQRRNSLIQSSPEWFGYLASKAASGASISGSGRAQPAPPIELHLTLPAPGVGHIVQLQVEHQDIHARLAEEAPLPALRLPAKEIPNLRLREISFAGHSRYLEFGRCGRNLGIEAGA